MGSLAAPADLCVCVALRLLQIWFIMQAANASCTTHPASDKQHFASRNWFIMISLIFVGYHWRWLRSLTLNPISLMLIGRSSNCIACHYFSLAIIDCHPASLTLVGISSIFIGGHWLLLRVVDFHPTSLIFVGISLSSIGYPWFWRSLIFTRYHWCSLAYHWLLSDVIDSLWRSLIFIRYHECSLAYRWF